MYKPFAAECGEMMKSPLVVKASLPTRQFEVYYD